MSKVPGWCPNPQQHPGSGTRYCNRRQDLGGGDSNRGPGDRGHPPGHVQGPRMVSKPPTASGRWDQEPRPVDNTWGRGQQPGTGDTAGHVQGPRTVSKPPTASRALRTWNRNPRPSTGPGTGTGDWDRNRGLGPGTGTGDWDRNRGPGTWQDMSEVSGWCPTPDRSRVPGGRAPQLELSGRSSFRSPSGGSRRTGWVPRSSRGFRLAAGQVAQPLFATRRRGLPLGRVVSRRSVCRGRG